MPTSASPSKAKAMIDTLDTAGDYLEIALKATKGDKDIADLNQALAQLKTTRSLLSKINTQAKYQIDTVRDKLPAVAKVLDTLVHDLGEGKPHSLRRVNGDIEDLEGETTNLQALLPGIWVESVGNIQKEGNDYMINGPVVKELEKGQLDGATFIAKGNVAAGKVQINSLVQTKKDMDFEKKPSK